MYMFICLIIKKKHLNQALLRIIEVFISMTKYWVKVKFMDK